MAVSLRAVVYIKQLSFVVASAIISSAQRSQQDLTLLIHSKVEFQLFRNCSEHIKNQHQYKNVFLFMLLLCMMQTLKAAFVSKHIHYLSQSKKAPLSQY